VDEVARALHIAHARLAAWDNGPGERHTRYPQVSWTKALLTHAELVLLSSEPYRFRDRDLAELRALPAMRRKNGGRRSMARMTSWLWQPRIAGWTSAPTIEKSTG